MPNYGYSKNFITELQKSIVMKNTLLIHDMEKEINEVLESIFDMLYEPLEKKINNLEFI
jgi:hypothetical protein